MRSLSWLTRNCASRALDDSFLSWLMRSARAIDNNTSWTMLPTGMANRVQSVWGNTPNSFKAKTVTDNRNAVKAIRRKVADFWPCLRASSDAGMTSTATDATALINEKLRLRNPSNNTASTPPYATTNA